MGMVKPSGMAFLATTSTRKKVASTKKRSKTAAKRKNEQMKVEGLEREGLEAFEEGNAKKARKNEWPTGDQREMAAVDGQLQGNGPNEGQFTKGPWKLRERSR